MYIVHDDNKIIIKRKKRKPGLKGVATLVFHILIIKVLKFTKSIIVNNSSRLPVCVFRPRNERGDRQRVRRSVEAGEQREFRRIHEGRRSVCLLLLILYGTGVMA